MDRNGKVGYEKIKERPRPTIKSVKRHGSRTKKRAVNRIEMATEITKMKGEVLEKDPREELVIHYDRQHGSHASTILCRGAIHTFKY